MAVRAALVLVAIMLSGQVQAANTTSLPQDGDDYSKLVAEAEAHDKTADYTALRMAWIGSAAYKRTSVSDAYESKKNLAAALHTGDVKTANEISRQIISDDYTRIVGHHFLWETCTVLKDSACAEHQMNVEKGLFRSILASGNGKSCATARKVISIEEEYDLLQLEGYKVTNQSLVSGKGSNCDKMVYVDRNDASKKGTEFFNVDAFLSHTLDK